MRPENPVIVEIAVHTAESAVAAVAGGANRVELLSNPIEGGVTPSEGLIATVRENVAKSVHVMIRPRGGDFHYSDLEFLAMTRDINMAKRLGANGVVFGLVNLDGTVDVDRTRQLLETARPMVVAFHRAFDVCCDLERALEDLMLCGVDRVLTSGGAAAAIAGISRIAQLVRASAGQITVVAAGSIRPQNIRQIVRETGVREVHAGLRSTISSPMQFQNRKISFEHAVPGNYELLIVKEVDVRDLVNEAGQL